MGVFFATFFLLKGSPVACDCQNSLITKWYETTLPYDEQRRTEEELIWVCHLPAHLKGKLFHDLTENDFDCSPQGTGTKSHCHAYDSAGVTPIPVLASSVTTTTAKWTTEAEEFGKDDYSNDDYDPAVDDTDVAVDTATQMDEEDMQDLHDLHVLLGLKGSNEEKKTETSANLKEGKREVGMQIILFSTFSCIIIIGVVFFAVLYVMRKKRKYSRERLNEGLADLTTRRISEPPPYQIPSADLDEQPSENFFMENRWDLPPVASYSAQLPVSPTESQSASGESKISLPDGNFRDGSEINLSTSFEDTQVCTDNSSLPTKM